jgi:hypothetical protein
VLLYSGLWPEIAADVRRCADCGAVIFHVHARDKDQKLTLGIDVFKQNALQGFDTVTTLLPGLVENRS